MREGTAGSVAYEDVVERRNGEWRIRTRKVTRRWPAARVVVLSAPVRATVDSSGRVASVRAMDVTVLRPGAIGVSVAAAAQQAGAAVALVGRRARPARSPAFFGFVKLLTFTHARGRVVAQKDYAINESVLRLFRSCL